MVRAKFVTIFASSSRNALASGSLRRNSSSASCATSVRDDTYTGLEQDKPVRTIERAREIAAKANAEEIRVFDGAFSSRLRVELEKVAKEKRKGTQGERGTASAVRTLARHPLGGSFKPS